MDLYIYLSLKDLDLIPWEKNENIQTEGNISCDVVLCIPPDASSPEHFSFHPSIVSGNEWQIHLAAASN